MANQVFRGQSLEIDIDMGEDISSGTNPKILYKKPDNTYGEWVAIISDRTLSYTATNGQLDVIGLWQLQGKISLSGKDYMSGIVTMNVEKSLND